MANNWTHQYLASTSFEKARMLFHSDATGSLDEELRLASSFMALGQCLSQQRDWLGAEPMYQKAMEIYERIHGHYHEDVATALLGQASCYFQYGHYEKAIKLYNQALKIYEKIRPEEHKDILNTLDHLCQCYTTEHHWWLAIETCNRMAKIVSKLQGPCSESLGNILFTLGRCYEELSNEKQACDHFKRALEIYEQSTTPDHEQLSNCQYKLASYYQAAREFLKAVPLYIKALSYFHSKPELENNKAYCTFALATCYMMSGDYKTEEYLKRARQLYEKIFGEKHPQTAYVLEAYARYLGTTSRQGEAKQLDEEAKQIRQHFFYQ